MLRIPDEIVEEARRLAVQTGLRMYAVGGLAAYAARVTDKEPEDYDLILVSPSRTDYEEYEYSIITPDDDGVYVVPFLPEDTPVTLTRTRYGGLRFLTHDDHPNVDLWWHPSVADYLNRSDKGSQYVVDPVTAFVYRRVESPVESADVYADGTFQFHHQFAERQGRGFYADAVDPRLDQQPAVGVGDHKIELRDPVTKKVLRAWDYSKRKPPAKAQPEPVKQAMVRWFDGDGGVPGSIPVTLTGAEGDGDRLRIALGALADAGKVPRSRHIILINNNPGVKEIAVVAGVNRVNRWHVSDGAGNTFDLFLHADDHPRNHQAGIAQMVARLSSRADYVTCNLPGTYDTYGFKVKAAEKTPEESWAVWIDGAVRPPRFAMPAGSPMAEVQTEARRVWRASGGLCLPGGRLNLQRSNDRGELTGAVTTFHL